MTQPEIIIESLDHEARGVGHSEEGKVVFVEGALIGERVRYHVTRKRNSFENAEVIAVLKESSSRVTPKCRHFGVCGGCSMQHLDVRAQVAVKQRVLEDNLWHIAKLHPQTVFRPIHGPSWGYRYRARLSVRDVVKKGGVLVGFHERKSSFVADMDSCEVLPPHVSAMLVPLRRLVEALSIRDRMPQIELAVGEISATESVTALVLRILEPLNGADVQLLRAFAAEHQVEFWLQSKGPDTVHPLDSDHSALAYTLPEFGVRMPFKPTDFTQVNHHINRVLVSRALRLLDAQPNERIADLFCGLGNFTLPIARRAREVVGIEGSSALTARATENAKVNGLSHKTSFATANLFEASIEQFDKLGHFDKVLIDPPREGAMEVCKVFAAQGERAPSRIVYVSCNPATLARDAGLLVNEGGYQLRGAGVVNMFPQTSHVESVALFEKG